MSNHLFDGLLANADPASYYAELTDGRYYRYQDVLDVSARFANFLVQRGVKPGDRVAAQVPKSIEALMLYLATVRAGAVFLPLNTGYTAHEIEYFLNDATPTVFFCNPDDADAYQEMSNRLAIQLETLGVWTNPETFSGSLTDAGNDCPAEFETVPRAASDLAAILYTSGTTGRAKGAMLTHANLLSNTVVLCDYWRFTQDDVLLHALPIYHTHGLFVASNVALFSGARMIFINQFNVDTIIENLPRATSMMGVPTFYTRLLNNEKFTRELCAGMRLFTSGSAPLLAETHQQFEERTGHRILERYGMTETNMNTSNPYEGERRAGTVGFALPDVEARVADPETGSVIAQGETGSIEVRGPNVFQGYWQMPEKTKEEFRDDGFFITGDLGKFDEDGYLHIIGRAKDLIISGGFNVYPKEIELLLDDEPGVLESAVIGVPHADFGEAVMAVVVPQDGAELDADALTASVAAKLAKFKQPKKIEIAESLPRNTMGKVQKNALRELWKGAFDR